MQDDIRDNLLKRPLLSAKDLGYLYRCSPGMFYQRMFPRVIDRPRMVRFRLADVEAILGPVPTQGGG